MRDLAAKVRYVCFSTVVLVFLANGFVPTRVITICLTRCKDKVVMPLFASCLSMLPNLHTLQIVHAHSQMTTALKNAFENKSYPQIRTIIFPGDCGDDPQELLDWCENNLPTSQIEHERYVIAPIYEGGVRDRIAIHFAPNDNAGIVLFRLRWGF